MASPNAPSRARRAQEQELRRADVLAAAIEVFAERGFDGSPVGDIARRAGVSNSTIYALYESKEGLYQAALVEISERMRARVDEAVSHFEDPVERLLATVDALCGAFESDRLLLHMFMRDVDGAPWKVRQTLGGDGLAIYQSFAQAVVASAEDARAAGRLTVMSPASFAHFLLGAVCTALMRSVQDDPDHSVLDLGAELRAGIARMFEAPA